jgi:hypothetical protein
MNWKQLKFLLSRPPKTQIKFIVTTFIDGKISNKFYGKSLVGNFLQMIYTNFANNDSADFPSSGAPFSSLTSTRNTAGTLQSTYSNISFNINVNTAQLTGGLIIGTGDTTPAAGDYCVETLIPEGTGAGQMSYQNQTATQGCEISSLTTSFILQRLFVNNSGGQIDVNEICLYTKSASYTFCIYRDVLPSSDEVPNGSTYRVTLEISVTT